MRIEPVSPANPVGQVNAADVPLEVLPLLSTAAQLAILLQTTSASLAQDRYLGRGVPFVKCGKRVRYLREDVLAYLTANRIHQTGR